MEQAAIPSDCAAATGTHSSAPNHTADAAEQRVGPVPMDGVGRRRLIHTAARRAKFVARFIYWTCRHGSWKHAGWVCNMEGLSW